MEKKDTERTTNSGEAPTNSDDASVPNSDTRSDGQHVDHWIMSDEERSKGYIRPVRLSYVHVGLKPKYPLCDLTEKQKETFGAMYAKYEKYPEEEHGVGRFWTQKDLDNKGCGTETSMPRKIAETYAVNPKYYGSTFCCTCKDYLPVKEFVWQGTEETVGS